MKIYFTYSPSDVGLFKEGGRYQQGMLLEGQYNTSQETKTIGQLYRELARKGLHAKIRPLSPLTDNDWDTDPVLLQEDAFYELYDAGHGLEGNRKPTRYARRFIDRFREFTSTMS